MFEGRIQVTQQNIVKLEVDAIVNAANTSLLGGGGVDGAIHRAAGKDLVEECRILNGCKTGQAKITGGYRLPAKHVIHTVGPVWNGGGKGEPELLTACYRNSLQLCVDHQLKTVAFPAISCGAYGYPISQAASIAVKTVFEFLKNFPLPESVIFSCYEDVVFQEYENALAELMRG